MIIPELKIEISASTVTWFTAFIAIASFVLSLSNYFRDSVRIKVKVSNGFLTYSNGRLGELMIFVKAINIGRRPVTLEAAGLKLTNNNDLAIIKPDGMDFPCELFEGKSTQFWLEKNKLLHDLKSKREKILYAWYRDASGKIYKGKTNLIK